jgi:hypothetical protein
LYSYEQTKDYCIILSPFHLFNGSVAYRCSLLDVGTNRDALIRMLEILIHMLTIPVVADTTDIYFSGITTLLQEIFIISVG